MSILVCRCADTIVAGPKPLHPSRSSLDPIATEPDESPYLDFGSACACTAFSVCYECASRVCESIDEQAGQDLLIDFDSPN